MIVPTLILIFFKFLKYKQIIFNPINDELNFENLSIIHHLKLFKSVKFKLLKVQKTLLRPAKMYSPYHPLQKMGYRKIWIKEPLGVGKNSEKNTGKLWLFLGTPTPEKKKRKEDKRKRAQQCARLLPHTTFSDCSWILL